MSLVHIAEHEEIYADRMGVIANEKAALLRYAPRDAIVLDYGCGEGDVIETARRLRPDLHFIGYDAYAPVIATANHKHLGKVVFTADEDDAFARAARHTGPKVLFMSSVVHEVVSFYGHAGFLNILNKAARFDQVIVRDMAYEDGADTLPDVTPPVLATNGFADALYARWGGRDTAAGVAHLMLKARYPDNWDAELAENYMPYAYTDLVKIVSAGFPRVIHQEYRLPPFLAEEFARVYGRVPLTKTHINLICERV